MIVHVLSANDFLLSDPVALEQSKTDTLVERTTLRPRKARESRLLLEIARRYSPASLQL
jgi:hypothetical protein